jgi:hypothetical protein
MPYLDIHERETNLDSLSFIDITTYKVKLLPDSDFCGYLYKYHNCCGYALYCDISHRFLEREVEVIKEILEDNEESSGGFGAVLATVVDEGLKEKLEENDFELLCYHTNPLSGNIIYTLRLTL